MAGQVIEYCRRRVDHADREMAIAFSAVYPYCEPDKVIASWPYA